MEKNEKRGRTEKKRGRRAKRRCDWPGRGEKCRERRSPTPRQNTGPSSAERGEHNITLVLIIITRALRLWCSWCIGLMQTLQTYWILNFSAYSKLRKEKRTKKHFLNFLDGKRKKEEKWIHSTETDGKEEMHVIINMSLLDMSNMTTTVVLSIHIVIGANHYHWPL